MKNILTILKGDLKRIGTSVVAVVVILGLCAVPCLYAWFNILSNWDPYGSDSTSRMRVAVASADKGAELLGLSINVGDQVIDALEKNSDIGWVFVSDSDEALDRVYSSDCYAALIVPEDFTQSVLSFLDGSITSPKLDYYQNDKMNAIAPKITGKAKTAVQEQVNATFIQTIASDIADVISVANANGVSADSLLSSFGKDVSDLRDKLGDCCAALDAANGLAGAARNLIRVSVSLCSSTSASLEQSKNVLYSAQGDIGSIDDRIDNTEKAVNAALDQSDADLAMISSSLSSAFSDINRYNEYVSTGLSGDAALVNALAANCSDMADSLAAIELDTAAGQMRVLAAKLSELGSQLSSLEEANDVSWDGIRQLQTAILATISDARATIASLKSSISSDLAPKLHSAMASASDAAAGAAAALNSLGSSTAALSGTLSSYLGSIGTMQSGFADTKNALEDAQAGLDTVSQLISALAGSELFAQLSDTLENDGALIGDYLSSPISMDSVVIYPVDTYGAAMAPFYTVLAQWVGALLCATLLKVKLRSCDAPDKLKTHERFFGRYALFFFVAMAQALIVSLGDLWYVGIQCLSPWRFVLAACATGLCFSMINYALVFALDNIGMAISVIVMVVQVAGSGGTYPVEVLPQVFRDLYDFMPFKYAMDAMRETVAGMYGSSYAFNVGILLAISVGAVIFGIALYRPFKGLNSAIASSKRKSEVLL